jgi:hypothetical protein
MSTAERTKYLRQGPLEPPLGPRGVLATIPTMAGGAHLNTVKLDGGGPRTSRDPSSNASDPGGSSLITGLFTGNQLRHLAHEGGLRAVTAAGFNRRTNTGRSRLTIP